MSEYWTKVRDLAADLGTDGCTGASSVFRDCCLRHDCEYRRGVTTGSNRPLTRKQADQRFLACMQARSIFGWWTPTGWARYAAVRWFGRRHFHEAP
jgi:hypothetical protein